MDRSRDHFLAGPRFALNEHGGRAGRHPRDELVDLEHGGALPHQGVPADILLRGGLERDGDFRSAPPHPAEGPQELFPAYRQGEEVLGAELLRTEGEPHRGPVREGDEARRPGPAAQRVGPPVQILVGMLAQHREDHVPVTGRQPADGMRKVGDELDVRVELRHPGPNRMGQPPIESDPQYLDGRGRLGGRGGRGFDDGRSGHAPTHAPPRYFAIRISASSVPLPWVARIRLAARWGASASVSVSMNPSRRPSVANANKSPGSTARVTGARGGTPRPRTPPLVTRLVRTLPPPA